LIFAHRGNEGSNREEPSHTEESWGGWKGLRSQVESSKKH